MSSEPLRPSSRAQQPVGPSGPGSSRLSFRPDIQGIRALAVLLVIVHHLGGHGISGGFIGVDVFFVVSGFLITSLLVREVDRTGRVSLVDFYARRARRILPAATVVTLATVVGSTVLLAMLRTQTVITDAVWATLFAANVRFAMVGTDYFAQGEPPSPLQHYWSLSVEEQFYLVWPVILLLCAVWARRRSRTAGRRLSVVVLATLVAASLAWSMWATYHSPTTAYFSTFARAWELGVGAGCALLLSGGRWRPPAAVSAALPWAGLAAIGVAALWLTPRTPFPGIVATLPVLGAAALILGGAHERPTVVGRVLSSPPAVRVGDWSYSLYLWHWPLIILVRSQVGPQRFNTPAFQLVMLVLIFVLSWATYRWVETPFRSGHRWRVPVRALAIYPSCLALVFVGVFASDQTLRYRLGEFGNDPAISTSDYPSGKLAHDSYVALVEASVLAARDGRAVPSKLQPRLLGLRDQTASLGDCDYRTGTRKLCPVGDPRADRTIVVTGDSHARALSPAVEALGRKYGYKVYVLVYSGCMASTLEEIDHLTGRTWGACEDFKAWVTDTVASMHPDLVLVSSSYGRFVDPGTGDVSSPGGDLDHYLETLRTGFRQEFETFKESADAVYVVGNTPKLPRETGVCLSHGDPDLGDCAFRPGRQATAVARTSFEAARDAGVGVVDARKWFCADGLCPSVVGSFITMRDSEHMTPDYARWLATPLARALGVGDAG
ncbi:acyltransferase family protein [Nocardioides sp. MAHUQ-72]|uniref:acyltransferase family protein n=1 Tax=unclassified Nocardioides TaxID=2615069 RepID=UPI003619F15B